MTSFSGLSILTVLTIVLASASYLASRGSVDSRLLMALSVIYAAALWLRQYFYRDETTFFDADHDGLQREKEGLIIFGNEIEDLAEESRERRLLMNLVDFGGEKYKIYLAWMVSVVLAVLLQTRFHALTVLDIAAPVLILWSIYFSPFLSQMLVPLALSLFLALFAISRSDSWPVAIYFAMFLLSFSLSLVILREVTPDRLNRERKTRLVSLLKIAAAVSALFFAFYFLFDFVVPEENPFGSHTTIFVLKPKSKFSVDRLARKVAEEAVKFQEPSGGGLVDASGNQPGAPGGAGQSEGTSGGQRGSGAGINRANGNANGSPGAVESGRGTSEAVADRGRVGPGAAHGSSPGDAPAGGFANVKAETKAEPKFVRPGNSASAEKNINSSVELDSKKSDEPSATVESSDQENIWQKLPENKPNGKPMTAATTNSEPTAGKGSGPGADGAGPGHGAGNSQTGGGESPSGSNSSGVQSGSDPKSVEAAREIKIEEVKRKLEIPLEIGKGILFLVAAAVFLPILSALISRWNKKPEDEIKRQQLTSRQKKKLQSILHQIRTRGLSSDAEVIETYNAVLSVFELGHHPRDEWLPAEDFSKMIGETIPPLKSPFGEATIRFSRTLYGRKNVAPDELQKFRQEVEKILRFFQVSET